MNPTSRRAFLKTLGGGLLVTWFAPAALVAQGRRRGGGDKPRELAAWLHIGGDGNVRVFTGKAEVGQNIRTSLAQVVAEELRVPISSIEMVMADTDLVPWDAGTFGSRTTPDMASYLRKVAATAREMLLETAAETWGVAKSTLSAENGEVRGGGRSVSYGDLTQGRKLTGEMRGDAPTRPAAEWTVAGTSVAKVDGAAFVTGAHVYASDMSAEGMLHGKVLRPPSFGAELKSLDVSAVDAKQVVRDGGFVGVVAESPTEAESALAKLKAEWDEKPQVSEDQLYEHLRKTSPYQPGGDGDHSLAETYTVAFIAHAPLEPRAALARWDDGKLTVWTGTQRPFGVKDELMGAFRLPGEKVRVIVPDTGSGFGGKHSGEAAVEAARLAKACGRPVKLVWTREEEFTWAYFRPAGVIDVRSGIDDAGRLTSWEFHNINSGGAGLETPYQVPRKVERTHRADPPLRQGSYRGLAVAANCFARESHMDELAARAGLDPLEFRLRNLKHERLRAVLEAAAEKFGWPGVSENGRACGLACGIDKGGHVATCAEVEVTDGNVKVRRVTVAFECGAILNPRHLHGQVLGSVVMGIGGALTEAISFRDGRILNTAFSKYRVPRFSDVPDIDILLLDRKDLPSAGAGESPILGIAPAIGNAIRRATGKRPHAMPMLPLRG